MKKVSVLFAVCISITGCMTFSPNPPCPPISVFQNVVTVRFHVTDKETGLPIKEAATSMKFLKFSWEPNAIGDCNPRFIVEGKFLAETNADGMYETNFTTDFRTTSDSYSINYSVSKQQFERVDGTAHINRGDSERTIEIKLLNNTNQP